MKSKFSRRFVFSTIILCGFAAGTRLQAANSTLYWDGGTANIATAGDGASAGNAGNWSTSVSNWDQGSTLAHVVWTNANNDLAVFGGTAGAVTTTTAVTANKLTFNTNGYSVAGTNAVTLAGTTPAVDTASGVTATVSAPIAGSTAWSKTSAGTLVLNNSANTCTGAVTIVGGVLQIRDGSTNTPTYLNAAALAASSITVKSGAILDLPRLHATTTQNITWSLPPITLESGATMRPRASTGSDAHTISANIATSGSVTIDNNGGSYANDINMSGVISGTGTINYLASSGSGSAVTTRTLTLSNASTTYAGNWFVDYTGSTTDDYVALKSSAIGALGTGTVTLDDRAQINNNIASGFDSLTGITLQKSTSSVSLGSNPWVNAAATLTLQAGTVNLGTADSTIGTLKLNGTCTFTTTGGNLIASTITASSTAAAFSASGSGVTLVPAASGVVNNTGSTYTTTIGTALDFSNTSVTVNAVDATSSASVDLVFGGNVTGSAGFTKTGAGTLGVNSTASIAGPITLSAGAISCNNATAKTFSGGISGSGSLNVNSTGLVTLSGSSTGYTGNISVADGANFSSSAVTGGNLTLGSTSGANYWPDLANPMTVNNLTLNGTNVIRFATPPTAGTYTLFNYSGTLSGVAANIDANFRSASLNMGTGTNSAVTLTVGAAASLVWNNATTDSIWETNSSANWLNVSSNDKFYDVDAVTFNDLPVTSQTVTVTNTVRPSSITFNNTIDYSLIGSGVIDGNCMLTKNGSGSVSIATANTFTQGTTVNAGKLTLGIASALGTGPVDLAGGRTRVGLDNAFGITAVTFNGGALSSDGATARSLSNPFVIANNAILGNATDNGLLTLTGAVSLSADETITADSDALFTGVISGAHYLTKDGSGTLTFTGSNTFIASTVSAGTIQVGNGAAAGTLPGSASNATIIEAAGTVRYFRSDAPLTLSNVFSGTGNLAFKGTGSSGQSGYVLTGNNTPFAGTLSAESGARVQVASATALSPADINVYSGGQVYITAGTYPNTFNIAGNGWLENAGRLGALRLSTGVEISGPVTLNAGSRISLYSSNTGIISGALGGAYPLEINSTDATVNGTLTYSGNGSALTGATSVSQGGLVLTGSLGGDLNISSSNFAASLAGEGSIGGSLSLGAGLLGANLSMDPNTAGTFNATGNLVLTNTTTVNFANFPSSAGTYKVLTYGGTLTGDSTNFVLAGSYRNATFDTTTTAGVVTVTVASANLTWIGAASAVWDVNATANWNTVPEKFLNLDAVTFDDTASNFAPTLAVTVNPTSVTFSNSTNYTLTGAGVIAGSTGITKSGTGSVTLSTPNTFTGAVVLNNGTLKLGNASALGAASGTTTINGGNLDINAISSTRQSVTLAGGKILNSSATQQQQAFTNLTVTGNAAIGGTSRWDVRGATGTTTINSDVTLTKEDANLIYLSVYGSVVNNGTIQVNGGILADYGGAISGSGSFIVGSSGTLSFENSTDNPQAVSLGGGVLGSLASTTTNTQTGNVTLTADSFIRSYPANTFSVIGVVSGAYGITVPALGGTVNLNAANTFSGGLTVGPDSVTATTVNVGVNSSLSVNSGKSVRIGNTSAAGNTTQTLSVSGSITNAGTLLVGRPGVLTLNNGGIWSQSGDMSLAAQGGYSANLNILTGGVFTYSGSNTVKLNGGNANSGQGNFVINGGTFNTSAGFEQTTVPTVGFGNTTLSNGGILKLTANIAQLTTNTQFVLGTGGGTIDTNGFDAALSGINSVGSGVALTSGISGAGSLTKAGNGTLTLSGANTYAGTTTINAGILNVTGSTVGSSTVTLNNNATLAGSGSVGGTVAAPSGTTIAPGNASAGTLNTGATTLGGTLAIQVDGATSDKLNVTGNLSISGSTLTVSLLPGGFTSGGSYVIAQCSGTLSGTFASVPAGYQVTYTSTTATLSQLPGYVAWAATNAGGQDINLDYDNDGVTNGIEYFMGQTGSGFTSNPGIVSGKVSWLKGASYTGVYGTDYVVQTSPDLAVWTNVSASDPNLSNTNPLEYTLPTVDPKFFVRLKVTGP